MSKATPEDIESLVELFNRSDWDEIHLKTDSLEIFLSNDPNASGPAPEHAVASHAPSAATDAPAPIAVPTTADVACDTAASAEIPAGMVAVRAPNLGTFYCAPKPGEPPYVEVGQNVNVDTDVCLIEVMKLFTPVKAGVSGVVREVLVEDAHMVEFDQALVIIEPA